MRVDFCNFYFVSLVWSISVFHNVDDILIWKAPHLGCGGHIFWSYPCFNADCLGVVLTTTAAMSSWLYTLLCLKDALYWVLLDPEVLRKVLYLSCLWLRTILTIALCTLPVVSFWIYHHPLCLMRCESANSLWM